ncbi:MAG: formate--tetrahydrofolate ligase [Bacilli bacterium]|nr:formate--tetrahydrofolate ligase [Bacilli bacterium]
MINLREIINQNKLENVSFYGEDKAKILADESTNKEGNIILITSTSPTKYGEGKTTLAISLNDALNKLNYKSIVALREPSLGPVFGIKGGACGGGKAKIVPEMDINLHFTGDIHAITTANNLLSAIIDNHIFQGNELGIDEITHERCMDLNDRSLRNLTINEKETHFNISTASEMMAILGLAKNEQDLKKRVGNILVGYTKDKKEVLAKDLKCVKALMLLLKEAIKPNLVKSLENNLALVHGGPFANIAHGTCSVISLKYALNHFPFTIVEAGFGSDMGGVKFFDIVSRTNQDLTPKVVVINTTLQSLYYNGEMSLEKGISNLDYHIDNMQKYCENLVVVLNKHEEDKKEEIEFVKEHVLKRKLLFSVSEGYLKGSEGSLDLAKIVVNLAEKERKETQYTYELEETLEEKINKFCQKNYGAQQIIYTEKARKKLELIKDKLPICVAKTQYSITDDAKKLGYPKAFTMTVSDIKLFKGAGFITVYFGSILTMPGLSKEANYLKMEEELF